MTDEQINAAIAEACGWRAIIINGGSGFYKGFDNGAELRPDLPDYVNDLNAMHEAEKVLSVEEIAKYVWTLCDPSKKNIPFMAIPFMATSRQRAEAFLKALGKWEEGK